MSESKRRFHRRLNPSERRASRPKRAQVVRNARKTFLKGAKRIRNPHMHANVTENAYRSLKNVTRSPDGRLAIPCKNSAARQNLRNRPWNFTRPFGRLSSPFWSSFRRLVQIAREISARSSGCFCSRVRFYSSFCPSLLENSIFFRYCPV